MGQTRRSFGETNWAMIVDVRVTRMHGRVATRSRQGADWRRDFGGTYNLLHIGQI